MSDTTPAALERHAVRELYITGRYLEDRMAGRGRGCGEAGAGPGCPDRGRYRTMRPRGSRSTAVVPPGCG